MSTVPFTTVPSPGRDLAAYADQVAAAAQQASCRLATASGASKNQFLHELAARLHSESANLLEANNRDVDLARQLGQPAALIDRLQLSEKRLAALARGVEEIAALPDPVGEVIDGSRRPNGLAVTRVRVPLGVVFFIYESRPNVTIDAAALCIKSGNAVILRGGSEAWHSTSALARVVRDSLLVAGLPADAAVCLETTDRSVVGHLLRDSRRIAVTIPRGGKSLIERVAAEAAMPVIKHYDGVCHVYVDEHADLEMAERIIVNAKCQRPGVCNAAECLLVHAAVAEQFLPRAAAALVSRGVSLRGCPRTCALVPGARPATAEDYHTEYLDLVLSVRVVGTLEQALEHIEEYGSRHTDAIVTASVQAARRFTQAVDSAAVMVNASTRFHDGAELGLGAEIGISTDKFHARGPCGLRELTSYKYLVEGSGQTREE
jgi:glutamate-5-semialdehyde dehydrogenase